MYDVSTQSVKLFFCAILMYFQRYVIVMSLVFSVCGDIFVQKDN